MSGLFEPWQDGGQFDGDAGFTIQDAGHIKGGDEGVRISSIESEARWRMSDDHEINPTIGYALRRLSFASDSPLFPESLIDLSLGIASPIARLDTQWFVAGSAGIGYAGDDAFGDSAAWYGRGTALLGKEINKNELFYVTLSYDGNRTLYPDIPIPGFAYYRKFDQMFEMKVGFPNNLIEWRPRPDVEVTLHYSIPSTFELKLGYAPVEHWSAFVLFRDDTQAYHVEDYPSHDRLFYDDMRAEAGVQWAPWKQLKVIGAVGYAFDQELHKGFDTRNDTSVARFSDEPYLRVALQWRH